MSNMSHLAQVIGSSEIDNNVIPALIQLQNDKNWRVKYAIIQFVPTLVDFIDRDIFQNKLEDLVLGWLSDPVF